MNARVALVATVLGLAAFTGPGRAVTEPKTDLLPIHGTVVSTDAHTHTILLRYTTPGSNPTRTRHYRLEDPADLARLRRGMVIDATANSTKTPWTLSRVNIESTRPLRGQHGE
ncbi:MAG: hypothetical protein ABI346_04985 [Candidatus Baltobacteraceae bacterium]